MSDVQWAVDMAVQSILKWTNNDAELAQQVAIKLASLNWQLSIQKQQREKIERQMWAMEDFLEWIEKGGRFCDNCPEGRYEKVYSWPHTVSPDPDYLPLDKLSNKHYCWQCFHKMQSNAEIALLNKYRREHSNLSFGTFIRWKHKMVTCSGCGRLFPEIVGYRFEFKCYCLHCVELAIEEQFKVCSSCGKKTVNTTSGYCYDCYPTSSKYGSQVSGHLTRARAANTPATLTAKQWEKTVKYFNRKCAYCQLRPFQILEHFLPISLGGGTTFDNCVPSCQNCNSRKGNGHPDGFHRIFPQYTVDRIKNYLQGEHNRLQDDLYKPTGRELVVVV